MTRSEKPDLTPSPLTARQLEAYRLRSQRQRQQSTMGGHLTKRRGQSLEFRDYAPYQFGDDVRHIDWRASARYKGKRDHLVRYYQAENQFTIVISVDLRPSLWLPKFLPKLQVALWIAESIARVALAGGDRLFLHSLFSSEPTNPIRLERSYGLQRLPYALRQIADQVAPEQELLNFRVLEPVLRPATVWMIITDLYFADVEAEDMVGDTAGSVASAIAQARSGLRWVALVDLDTWNHETALIKGNYYVDEPAASATLDPYDLNKNSLVSVSERITEFKARFLQLSRLPVSSDYSRWEWPSEGETSNDPTTLFVKWFLEDQNLRRLFERAS